MKSIALAALLLSVPAATITTALATTERREVTPAPRAQAVENDDFDEWGLLGLLGLAGLLGLRRNKPGYTDKDYVGKTGYDRQPGA